MLDTLLAKVVGTQNDRELKRLAPHRPRRSTRSRRPFRRCLTTSSAARPPVRRRIANGETVDDLMAEAFAVVHQKRVAAS